MKFNSLFKKLLVVVIAITFVSGVAFGAKKSKPKKAKIRKGAKVTMASGTLIHWKDIEKVSFKKGQKRKMRPIMNFEDPRKIKKQKKVDRDPVAQTSHGNKLKGKEALAMSSPIIDFVGMNQSANGAGWPPDTNGDVGPTYFIQTVNTSIGIYNKSTGAKVSSTTFDAFFPSAVGAPCDNDNNGDPIVLYDRYNERWFILDFAWSGSSGPSYYSIAASKTSDPTGAWWTYCFQADSTLMNDYPKCGVWHDGIYITANMFQFSGSYQHSKVWAIKTPDLYTGTLTSQNVTDSGTFAFSLMPVSAKSPSGPSTSAPNYVYAMDASEYGSGHSDALYVWKYNIDWVNSSNTTWTGPTKMTAATFGLVSTKVPQSGTSNTLDSLAGRLMYPANYWNYGTHESVFLSHVVEYSSRRAMRWYEIRISGGSSSIYQQGTYSPDSTHRWMGAVAGDKNGSIAMGYSASSSSIYPAVRYAGRLSSDTLGTMGQGEATMEAGGGYQSSYSRWGDYSSIFIDPSDDETFWYTTEYYTSSGTNWNTRIGSFKVSGGTPPVGTLGEALDTTQTFTTTCGDNGFSKVTSTYYYDGDSAQSDTITHNQTSCMETTISGYTSVKFYWKVSSESGYDYLRFYIDGVEQSGSIAGTVDWTQKSYTVSTASHTLRWVYDKDYSVSTGSDCGWVDKLELDTSTPPPTYCTSKGNNYSYEWISRVRVGSLDNSSGAAGYTDFTGTTVNLTRGNSASVTLNPGFSSSSYTEYWKIWIDYNQDGDFTDSGEEVFSGVGSSAVSGSFTVSSGATTGATRMRVSMKWDAAQTSCETFSYGEVEDYTVNIQ